MVLQTLCGLCCAILNPQVSLMFIRELVDDKKIRLEYCPTNEMAADLLTKPLPRARLAALSFTLGLRQA